MLASFSLTSFLPIWFARTGLHGCLPQNDRVQSAAAAVSLLLRLLYHWDGRPKGRKDNMTRNDDVSVYCRCQLKTHPHCNPKQVGNRAGVQSKPSLKPRGKVTQMMPMRSGALA